MVHTFHHLERICFSVMSVVFGAVQILTAHTLKNNINLMAEVSGQCIKDQGMYVVAV